MPSSKIRLCALVLISFCFLAIAAAAVWTVWLGFEVSPAVPVATQTPSRPQIAATVSATPAPPIANRFATAFIGHWTGHWTGGSETLLDIFKGKPRHLFVSFQWQVQPDDPPPMLKDIFRPLIPQSGILHLHTKIYDVHIKLSDTTPNTALAHWDYLLFDGKKYHKDATLVRNGDSTSLNFLPPGQSDLPDNRVKLDIKVNMEGNEMIHLSGDTATWLHSDGDWPDAVTINNLPWDVKTQPNLAHTGLADIDLGTARVIFRTGKDVSAIEFIDNILCVSLGGRGDGALSEIVISAAHKSASSNPATHASPNSKFITIDGDLDGLDVLTLTSTGAVWDHKSGPPPANVKINGEIFNIQSNPTLPLDLSHFNFATAMDVKRKTRDSAMIERADDSVTIYFADYGAGRGHVYLEIAFDPK